MKPRNELDRTRPFGIVYGLGGVAYEQDGRYFNDSGKSVKISDTSEPVEEPAIEETDDGSNVKPAEVVESPPPAAEGPTDFDNMHHMKLKAALRVFEEPYTTRESAIEFLKGKKAA